MLKQELVIQNQLGLHTRAAAKLVNVAKRFSCKIELIFRDRVVDAKSIMGVITLGAQKQQHLTFTFDGADAEQACTAITQLINNKFDESN